jgi:hypothetical protein
MNADEPVTSWTPPPTRIAGALASTSTTGVAADAPLMTRTIQLTVVCVDVSILIDSGIVNVGPALIAEPLK